MSARAPRGSDAYLTGLRWLARRELFTTQLRERLARRGFTDEEIDDAIRRLVAGRALDDRRAATAYARDAASLKLRGAQRTLRELEQRGVDAADARLAIDAAYGDIDERSLVERVVARRHPGPIDSPQAFRRVYAALRRQGYAGDAVLSVLRRRAVPSVGTCDDEGPSGTIPSPGKRTNSVKE